MAVSPWENSAIFEIAVGDFLAKNLCLSLLIMSVGVSGIIRGLKSNRPATHYKKFSGVEILYTGFNGPTSPSNTVGPWEWRANALQLHAKVTRLDLRRLKRNLN